jgi:preprotein translocase subunit YajC
MTVMMLLFQTTDQGNPMMAFLFPLLILLVFYFFLLRPKMKGERERQQFIDNLKEGQEVVTAAGVIGKVVKIDGQAVRLLIDEKTYMRVLKSSVSGEYKQSS